MESGPSSRCSHRIRITKIYQSRKSREVIDKRVHLSYSVRAEFHYHPYVKGEPLVRERERELRRRRKRRQETLKQRRKTAKTEAAAKKAAK